MENSKVEAANSSSSSSSSKSSVEKERPQWREAVAGACAGAFSRTVLAPVERVKLLKQLSGSVRDGSDLSKQQSAWQVAKTVYYEQGVAAFWRGNVPNVIRVSGTAAVNFTCMEYYKRVAVAPWFKRLPFQRHATTRPQIERRRRLATSLVSGGLAGATATTVLYPVEFLRTRLAMDVGGTAGRGRGSNTSTTRPRQYSGMLDVLGKIFAVGRACWVSFKDTALH